MIVGTSAVVPALFADAGEHAAVSVIEFFTANIRNPNTRAAYGVAVRDFTRGVSAAASSWPGSARPTSQPI